MPRKITPIHALPVGQPGVPVPEPPVTLTGQPPARVPNGLFAISIGDTEYLSNIQGFIVGDHESIEFEVTPFLNHPAGSLIGIRQSGRLLYQYEMASTIIGRDTLKILIPLAL